ncbi:acyl-CoA dehydrogenase family protein [Rhodococcus rhodochrous]|uniref:Alkylation response protein AidB-like acyl-CoA dehydrogenase n=1 Tax=Rhodococcus rhodochrous J45 TaxID=935266 RepID=A0A562E865_RHORH|nr:acyl-CoA dehydrogenase family protein [Rhodococcus rhodochrous]TWH17987.1 alkylation response protein AidB-like acyl-CoA dehydrogenase [Rhodococcus rhodochrous J45]
MSPEELIGRVDALVRQYPIETSDPRDFLEARFDAGLAWVWAAPGEGGLGLDSTLQALVESRLAEKNAPLPFSYNPIGIGMTGPTLLAHGTAQQKSAYLRPLFSGREVWSQLFSEPSVGSDVAGLATRARRDGDDWVVDGQKVWTSWAHIAGRGLLLARTDPDVPKHAGLTAFVLDMTAPGVEVRPLRQMTGEAEFNEVYLVNVRIPDSDRIGEVGEGWRIATTTLMNERFSLGGTMKRDTAEVGAEVLDAYRAAVDRGDHNPVRRDEAVRLWIEANVNNLIAERSAAATNRGRPGPEGSVLKLATAEYRKRAANFLVDLLGAPAMLVASYRMNRPRLPLGQEVPETTSAFLRSRANTIEGGTSEILRNILGERVLGLPGDLRVDKGIPWRDIPR